MTKTQLNLLLQKAKIQNPKHKIFEIIKNNGGYNYCQIRSLDILSKKLGFLEEHEYVEIVQMLCLSYALQFGDSHGSKKVSTKRGVSTPEEHLHDTP